jgi:regulator of protease activity HflC (stomatin/prohibitin superfamily)
MNVASGLKVVATFSWILLIAVIALAVVRASRGKSSKGLVYAIILTLIAAIVLTTVSAGLVFIQPEDRGVVISAVAPKGYRENPLQPGLNWIIPFFETVKVYPIYRQTYTMSIAPLEGQVQGDDSVAARTSDGQEVIVDASVLYGIDPNQVIQVHIAWQDRYSDDLVRPLSRGVIRDAISQYGVEEVVSTKRFEMAQLITEEMGNQLSDNGLILQDFILRNITFSPEYAASVEQKQIAEQQAKQAELVIEQKKAEAEQARQVAQGRADAVVIDAEGDAAAIIIKAEADAQALELIAAALQGNQDLLTYQYITKLSPNIQAMLLPSGNPFLFTLPDLEASSSTIITPESSAEPYP